LKLYNYGYKNSTYNFRIITTALLLGACS